MTLDLSLASFLLAGITSAKASVDDPVHLGDHVQVVFAAPRGRMVATRDLRRPTGTEFRVVACRDIMTMPGLPKATAADQIKLNEQERFTGLF